MRDHIKKPEDDLLVVHKAAPAGKTGQPPPAEGQLLHADVAELVARLAASTPDERARLLGTIQSRFGNTFATHVIETLRRGRVAPGPAAGKPSSGQER